MARPEKYLERDGSPVREFAFWLRDLRSQSGLTYDQLGKRAGFATSTMQDALAGRRLPTLTATMAIVQACGGNQMAWHAYWAQIRRALDRDAPLGLVRSIEPPWAVNAPTPPDPPRASNHNEAMPSGASSEPDASELADVDSWYVESFDALLRLDGDTPEAVEQRTVVSNIDGLRELVTSVSVPRHVDDKGTAHGLDVELLHGGRLELREQPYESFFRNVVVLPNALPKGGRHEYSLRLRIPPGQPMAPHYVHVPLRRSDHFRLRIRFNAEHIPNLLWKLDGVPTAVIYERGPTNDILVTDRFGEVQLEFHGMREGLGYGLCWHE